MVHKHVSNLLVRAFLVSVVAGLFSLLFTSLLAPLVANPLGLYVITFVMIVVAIWVMPWAKVDNESAYSLLVLLAAISLVGSLVVFAVPAFAPYILNLSQFSWSGAIFSLVYIALAEAVLLRTKAIKF